MAFENVFGNIDWSLPVRQQEANRQFFAQMLGQQIQQRQFKQKMDMERRKLEQKGDVNVEKLAENALLKRNMGMPTTPQEDAAIQTMGQTQRPQIYTDPLTQQTVIRPSPWSALGGFVEQRPDLPNYAGVTAAQNQMALPGPQGQGTNPAITTPYDQITPMNIADKVEPAPKEPTGFGPYKAPPKLGGRGMIMEEETKQTLSEYAQKKGVDLKFMDAEQRQKLMFEKELAEQKMELTKKASMPSKIAETDFVFDDIGKAINLIEKSKTDISPIPPSGTAARLTSLISESDSGKLKSYLSTVQSGTGLGKLQAMRESSPTGASGLGQLNKSEMKILQDIAGEMQITTDVNILEQNLMRYYNAQMDLVHGTPEFIEQQVRDGKVTAKKAAPYLFRYDYAKSFGQGEKPERRRYNPATNQLEPVE